MCVSSADAIAHGHRLSIRSTNLAPGPPPGEPPTPRGDPMSYQGQERRRHRVYVTRNTEYHLRDGRCVAVRDRRTGEFLHGHLALEHRVDGGIKFFGNGSIAPNPGDPRPGESLYFASEGRDLVTSALESVE